MKKWLSTLTLALVFLIAGSGAIHAQDEISLVVNGNKIETDAPCFIENNRTLVPIRFIGESQEPFGSGHVRQIKSLRRSGPSPRSTKAGSLRSVRKGESHGRSN